MSAKPRTVQIRADHVTAYEWAVWCTIEDGEPFANTIVIADWTRDGSEVSFMLESFNFMRAKPDEILELVPRERPSVIAPKPAPKDQPKPKPACPTCGADR